MGKPEYRLSRLWYTSVAYVNAESRVRITALSGLTHVRISGRALYYYYRCLCGFQYNFKFDAHKVDCSQVN